MLQVQSGKCNTPFQLAPYLLENQPFCVNGRCLIFFAIFVTLSPPLNSNLRCKPWFAPIRTQYGLRLDSGADICYSFCYGFCNSYPLIGYTKCSKTLTISRKKRAEPASTRRATENTQKNDQAAVTLPGHLLFGVVSCHYKSRIPPLFVSNFGELLWARQRQL